MQALRSASQSAASALPVTRVGIGAEPTGAAIAAAASASQAFFIRDSSRRRLDQTLFRSPFQRAAQAFDRGRPRGQSPPSKGGDFAMHSPILAPIVVLVAWSLVMMAWLYAVRFPAMRRAGIGLGGRVGSKGGDLDGVVEPQVQWKAHNYNHLMEQPTLFYAVALSLALMDFGAGLNLYLAWAYVAFRVAHSLVQATTNVVRWRFLLFIGGSIVLAALTIHALLALFFHHHYHG